MLLHACEHEIQTNRTLPLFVIMEFKGCKQREKKEGGMF
jgi:hypothetical protein